MSHIFGNPWIVSEKDTVARWNCGKPGELFRCAWCGHKFEVGDVARCVYTNGFSEDTCGIAGNPFICQACDGPRDVVLAKLRELRAEWTAVKRKFWWFAPRGDR